MSTPLYSSGKIKGSRWQEYLSDAGPVYNRLSDAELKQLYEELRDLHFKYMSVSMIMQENKARGTIGDGYISEKAYLELEKKVVG